MGFVGAGRHFGLLCASRVFVAVVGWSWYFVGPLLSFLDGWGRGLHVALHGVDVVAKRTWVVTSGVSRLWEASLAWWLLVEKETSQGCDFGVTFNTHVESTNLWDVVWPYFKQVLLATRHPNITVNPSRVFEAENEHIYA